MMSDIMSDLPDIRPDITIIMRRIMLALYKHDNEIISSPNLIKEYGKNREYWRSNLTKLENLGLIEKVPKTRKPVFYKLTKKGISQCQVILGVPKILSVSDNSKKGKSKGFIRDHNFRFSSELVSSPYDFDKRLLENNWKEYYPASYRAFRRGVNGVMVIFSPHTVSFEVKEIYAGTVVDAKGEAFLLVDDIRRFLEKKYGVKIGRPECVMVKTGGHTALVEDPLSICAKESFVFDNGRLGIDHSKGLPELEGVDKLFADDDIIRIIDEMYMPLIKRECLTPKQLTKAYYSDRAIIEDLKESNLLFSENIKSHLKLVNKITSFTKYGSVGLIASILVNILLMLRVFGIV